MSTMKRGRYAVHLMGAGVSVTVPVDAGSPQAAEMQAQGWFTEHYGREARWVLSVIRFA
jgi:hypothetical protein